MNYKKFISEVPKESKDIILKAMEIYHLIAKKKIICNSYENLESIKKKNLNDTDKKYCSLFLASLLVDGNIKKIMNDCQVESIKVFDYLKIEEQDIKSLTEEQYTKYFEEDFKILLQKLKDARYHEHGRLLNSDFYAELIVANLVYEHVYETDIINWLYKDAGWNNDACSHISMLKIKDVLAQKLQSNVNNSLTIDDSVLEKYGEYLTERGFLTNPAIGREKEIEQLILALLTPEKSAMIVGEAGVGKTAIVEGLAYLIQNDQVPKLLKDTKIIKINTSTLLSGCMYVGSLEKRVEEIVKELIKQTNVILFIDEIHNIIGAGSSSKQNMDLADMLKPYLERGQIKMVGATTADEYEKYIAKDPALKRRFVKIDVSEPKEIITKKILKGTIPKIEEVTKVKFDFDIRVQDEIFDYLAACTNKKHRVYNDNVANPDLSLTILKQAFAYAALYESDSVQIEHIAQSIRNCERLNESSRNKYANELINILNNKKDLSSKSLCKVIQFPGNSLR